MAIAQTATAISWRKLLATQLRLLTLNRRRGLLILLAFVLAQVVALAAFGVILGVTISTGDEAAEIGLASVSIFTEEFDIDLGQGVLALVAAHTILVVFALFWPLAMWRDERPSGRDYHWAMPVDRRTHDMARVVVGAVLLLLTLAVAYAVAVAAAFFTGHAGGMSHLSPLLWAGLLLGPLVPYGVGSIFAVRCEHPVAWLWGLFGASALVSTVTNVAGLDAINRQITALAIGPWGIISATVAPVWNELFPSALVPSGAWPAVWLMWLAGLALAVFGAASSRS